MLGEPRLCYRRTEVTVTANTTRPASTTKHFTALSILLLIDGKLEFDTPLASIIPEFPSYAEDIIAATPAPGRPSDYELLVCQMARSQEEIVKLSNY